MFRKISFSIIWFIIFFLGGSVLMSLPNLIGGKDAHAAGVDVGSTYGKYLLMISIILSVTLCFKRVLPGTRKK